MMTPSCLPLQNHNTRYSTNKNFALPLVKTARGQSSIKYTGPKAWAKVPTNFKEIAFRKPFSKKLKKFVLDTQKQSNYGISPESTYLKRKKKKSHLHNELKAIFEESDDDSTFYGF